MGFVVDPPTSVCVPDGANEWKPVQVTVRLGAGHSQARAHGACDQRKAGSASET